VTVSVPCDSWRSWKYLQPLPPIHDQCDGRNQVVTKHTVYSVGLRKYDGTYNCQRTITHTPPPPATTALCCPRTWGTVEVVTIPAGFGFSCLTRRRSRAERTTQTSSSLACLVCCRTVGYVPYIQATGISGLLYIRCGVAELGR